MAAPESNTLVTILAAPDVDMVSIPREMYDRLMEDSTKLDMLHAHGVNNWEWYGDAMAEFYGEEDEDENE